MRNGCWKTCCSLAVDLPAVIHERALETSELCVASSGLLDGGDSEMPSAHSGPWDVEFFSVDAATPAAMLGAAYDEKESQPILLSSGLYHSVVGFPFHFVPAGAAMLASCVAACGSAAMFLGV